MPHTGNYTISTKGTYGTLDSNKPVIINGNVAINAPAASIGEKLVLQNITINGNLTANFGNGDVELNNVKLNGLTINQIGENSLHIKGNSAIGLLVIKDTDNKARVVVEENASVTNTCVFSGAKLEVAAGAQNAKPFSNVTIAPEQKSDVVLSGNFESIKVEKASKVVLDEKTNISNKIDIASAAEIEAKTGAEIAKIDIKGTSKQDKVVLAGDLKNVNLSSVATVEVKSGNIALSSSANEKIDLKVEQGAIVDIGKGKENINKAGSGTVTERPLNDNANIIEVLYPKAGEGEGTICNLPAAIKVSSLIDSIVMSRFASLEVIDENDKVVSSEQVLTETMKVKITSESGKTIKKYNVRLQWNDYPMNIPGTFSKEMYENALNIDKNPAKGMLTGTVSFEKPKDESFIDGYYVSIARQFIIKPNADNTNNQMQFEPIYSVYIPKSNTSNLYSHTFENIDLRGNKMLSYLVNPVSNNKLLTTWFAGAFDNPIDTKIPSSEGLIIDEFKDTNLEKGKIGGAITFTKPTDESNIAYYQVVVVKSYNSENNPPVEYWDNIGILQPSDFNNGLGKYSILIERPVEVGMATEVKILVIPFTGDNLGAPKEQVVSLGVKDLPNDEVKIEVPKVIENPSEPYSLIVSGLLEGATVNLYKYDESQKQYLKIIESAYAGGKGIEFAKLEVGLYKVTQKAKGVETEMSNEVKVKPIILSGVIKEKSLSLVNAIDGATIKVYDANGQVIKTLTKEAGKEALIEELADGTYYITQTVNGIESDRFLINTPGV